MNGEKKKRHFICGHKNRICHRKRGIDSRRRCRVDCPAVLAVASAYGGGRVTQQKKYREINIFDDDPKRKPKEQRRRSFVEFIAEQLEKEKTRAITHEISDFVSQMDNLPTDAEKDKTGAFEAFKSGGKEKGGDCGGN